MIFFANAVVLVSLSPSIAIPAIPIVLNTNKTNDNDEECLDGIETRWVWN